MLNYGITTIGARRYFDYDLLEIDTQKTMNIPNDVTPRYEQYDSEVTRIHDIDELLRLLEIERARRTITDAGSNES